MAEGRDGLIHGVVLDAEGGCRELGWSGVRQWSAEDGPLWVHLDRTSEVVQAWVGELGLDAVVCDILLAGTSRPRYVREDDGLLLTLRGVNLSPGADPEDMVSIRIWVDVDRLISFRRERIMTTEDVYASLANSRGPRTTGALLARIVHGLDERMAPLLDEIGEGLDDLDDAVIAPEQAVSRSDLVPMRHRIIALRRFLAPQRQAMAALCEEESEILSEQDRTSLRESANRLQRFVEDLDAARDRAVVIQDELARQMAERLNARIYVLTVIAAVVLPLSLLAGMLGMNVAGIPAADHPWAFALVSATFVAFGALLVGVLKWLRWI